MPEISPEAFVDHEVLKSNYEALFVGQTPHDLVSISLMCMVGEPIEEA